jgi:hypothetical protein
MTLPHGVPETFVKYSGATTGAGATVAARVDSAVDSSGGLNQYPRKRKRPRDNYSIGKSEPSAIRVVGANMHGRIRDILAEAGIPIIEHHQTGAYSLKREHIPAVLAALHRAKLSPEVLDETGDVVMKIQDRLDSVTAEIDKILKVQQT